VHNTQPWSFTADGRMISLYADLGRGLPVADPDGREMMISCGAALFNARLALRSLGYVPQTSVLPDPAEPALVARLRWGPRVPPTEFERRLAGQVRARRTHRGAFDSEPPPPDLPTALHAGAARGRRQLVAGQDPEGERAWTAAGCAAARSPAAARAAGAWPRTRRYRAGQAGGAAERSPRRRPASHPPAPGRGTRHGPINLRQFEETAAPQVTARGEGSGPLA
jgi:hypothetical protein